MTGPTVEESLCDALLVQFGLPGPLRDQDVEMPLSEARHLIHNHAREIIESLRDDGWQIVTVEGFQR
jgi:hypothetical protein